MQIKVNDAQMQEYGAYMDSVSGKLEAASASVQSVVSWMQNDEMLGENSRNRYLGKLKRAQRNLGHAADDARRFGPAIRQISENYQRNEQELMDELEQRMEEILARPLLPSSVVERAQNELAHSDLVSDDVDPSYRNTLIQMAENATKPEDLLSSGYLEEQGLIDNVGVDMWAFLNGDMRNVLKDPAMIQEYLLDNTLNALLDGKDDSLMLFDESSTSAIDKSAAKVKLYADYTQKSVMSSLLSAGIPEKEAGNIIKVFSQEGANTSVLNNMLKNSYKMSDDSIKGIMGNLNTIKLLQTGLSVASVGGDLVKGTLRTYNQALLVNEIGSDKLQQTADVFLASSDSNMRAVGEKLQVLSTGTTEEKFRLLGETSAFDTVLDIAQDQIAKKAKSQLASNPYGLAAEVSVDVLNSLLKVGDTPGLRNKIQFSNAAAHESYRLLQECVAECKANPTAENMSKLNSTYRTYEMMASESEKAVSDLYSSSTKSFVGQFIASKEAKSYVEMGKEFAESHQRRIGYFDGAYKVYEKYGV